MHLFFAVASSDSLQFQIPCSEFKLDINSNGKISNMTWKGMDMVAS